MPPSNQVVLYIQDQSIGFLESRLEAAGRTSLAAGRARAQNQPNHFHGFPEKIDTNDILGTDGNKIKIRKMKMNICVLTFKEQKSTRLRHDCSAQSVKLMQKTGARPLPGEVWGNSKQVLSLFRPFPPPFFQSGFPFLVCFCPFAFWSRWKCSLAESGELQKNSADKEEHFG